MMRELLVFCSDCSKKMNQVSISPFIYNCGICGNTVEITEKMNKISLNSEEELDEWIRDIYRSINTQHNHIEGLEEANSLVNKSACNYFRGIIKMLEKRVNFLESLRGVI